jgi:hypothetical protein
MAQIIQLASAGGERPLAVMERRGVALRTNAVHVVFTTIDETLAAMRIASELANALSVPVTVVHIRTVPYVLPVDAPNGLSPVETDGFVNRIREAGREAGVDVRLRVYLCRNPHRIASLAFKRHSLIVMAGRRSWWPTRKERWRRALEAAGHFVVFVDGSEHKERSDA